MGDTKAMDNISLVKTDGVDTYLTWSRSCLLYIKSIKLLGYINGEKKKPAASYNGLMDFENSLVMT